MYKKNIYKYKENGNVVISQHKPSVEYELMYRLIAQSEEFVLTNYTMFTQCIDIPEKDLELWFEVHKDDTDIKISQIEDLTNSINNLNNEIQELSQMDKNLVATTWEIDDRLYEVEWILEDVGIISVNETSTIKMKGMGTMALSKFEQAQIIITSGDYDKAVLEGQLSKYLKKGIITQKEYDTLISMMEAKDVVVGK